MLTVSVELLHCTYRGDPNGTANTGQLSRGEWPPSPARLFAALVAADGTRDKCCWKKTDGKELEWFEQLPPPIIFAETSPIYLHHQALLPRYVVRYGTGLSGGKNNLNSQQEYINRTSTLVRPGVRVSTRHSVIMYRWDVEIPDDSTLTALKYRAARVGYLGTSDSPVRVRFVDKYSLDTDSADAFFPDDRGQIYINIAKSGDLKILDALYDLWQENGASISRSQFPALGQEFRYRTSSLSDTFDQEGEIVARLRLSPAISGRRISMVTHLFKQSVLSHYQQIFGEPPQALHGHGYHGKGYETARYLALSDVGYQRSRGRIHGIALWMPPQSTSVERMRSRVATYAIRRLKSNIINAQVEPHTDGDRPIAANSWRWRGPSKEWVTAFPAIHERHHRVDLSEVSRWCRHAGLPEPIAVQSSRTPMVTGGVDLAPTEVNRPHRPVLPYSHIWIRFEKKVTGPIVIGSGRQRGFGLCVPL